MSRTSGSASVWYLSESEQGRFVIDDSSASASYLGLYRQSTRHIGTSKTTSGTEISPYVKPLDVKRELYDDPTVLATHDFPAIDQPVLVTASVTFRPGQFWSGDATQGDFCIASFTADFVTPYRLVPKGITFAADVSDLLTAYTLVGKTDVNPRQYGFSVTLVLAGFVKILKDLGPSLHFELGFHTGPAVTDRNKSVCTFGWDFSTVEVWQTIKPFYGLPTGDEPVEVARW